VTTSERFCPDGGWLVKGPTPVPDDPSDFHDGLSGTTIGCNRLRCARCGADVRSQRVWLDRELDDEARSALYAADDWTAIHGVHGSPEFRLYACRCATFQCTHSQGTLDTDRDDLAAVEPPPWLCQGHPAPALPLLVDGERVGGVDDLRPLAERVLTGWSPSEAPPPAHYFPAVWAGRVHRRLHPLPEADEWARLIALGLHGDEYQRGLALHFFALEPDAPGFEEVVELAERLDPARLGDVIRTWYGRSEDTSEQDWDELVALMGGECCARGSFLKTLLRRIGWIQIPLDEVDARARELVRAAVLADPSSLDDDALDTLAAGDGDWLARQARTVVLALEDGVSALMSALRGANREEPLVVAGVAIAAISKKRRDELAAWIRSMPDEDSAYAAVLRRALKR
jgi:hypothetical protein